MTSSDSRVLIADDDEGTRHALVRAFRSMGIIADEASDGSETLLRLEQKKFAALLLDVRMPVVSGYEIIHRLSNSPHKPEFIIIVTGLSDVDHDLLSNDSVQAMFRKPVDPFALCAVVGSMINRTT